MGDELVSVVPAEIYKAALRLWVGWPDDRPRMEAAVRAWLAARYGDRAPKPLETAIVWVLGLWACWSVDDEAKRKPS